MFPNVNGPDSRPIHYDFHEFHIPDIPLRSKRLRPNASKEMLELFRYKTSAAKLWEGKMEEEEYKTSAAKNLWEGKMEEEGENGEAAEKKYNLRSRAPVSGLYNEESQEMTGAGGENNCDAHELGRSRRAPVSNSADVCIQPVQIENNISFDDIGGLSEVIEDLKEVVMFPLFYPEFFARFGLNLQRGFLLCGPPGTGKTLIARALACEVSRAAGGTKVSFYMRKGADVLSQWAGEAERQLKLLFEEAKKNQPSIIFFDEIDGLAPVRSSRQDQVHNTIVSTLLALMDGLDSRGQIVLMGATNRVDAIDGALRRPGRFDLEFNCPLPDVVGRAQILNIHTRKWKEPPSQELKLELASTCVGYCGADLKALCTEAALRAFKESYPHVYDGNKKFSIDVDSIRVEKSHFLEAMAKITPAAHRGSIKNSRPLSPSVWPCMNRILKEAMNTISKIFPLDQSFRRGVFLCNRPRLLLCGKNDVGLDHLETAVLHELERFPVHSIAEPSLLSDPGAKTLEEALVRVFSEARRSTPSIVYLPDYHSWCRNADDQLKDLLVRLLTDIPWDLPILLLGTSSIMPDDETRDRPSIFSKNHIFRLSSPSEKDISLFFDGLIEAALAIESQNAMKQRVNGKSFVEDINLTLARKVHGVLLSDGASCRRDDFVKSDKGWLKQLLLHHSKGYTIPELRGLYTRIINALSRTKRG